MEYVLSPDGTRIAYERTGSGPPLVLVHGSLNDRNAWGFVRDTFAARFAVYAMDRRGRGESGAPAPHELERQFEDVVAVMEAAAEPVDLLGHSFGAHCALGAAALRPDLVKHLVLYEPPTITGARLDAGETFALGDPQAAVINFFREHIGMREAQIEAMAATPFLAYAAGFAGTMPTEARALVAHGFRPERFASLKMPALFLQGSETAAKLGDVMRQLAEQMPQAEWHTFEGQGHGAQLTAASEFASVVIDFLVR